MFPRSSLRDSFSLAASYALLSLATISAWVLLAPSAGAQSLPPITDLRIEAGELRWTAPANVGRYSVRYYTGETTDRTQQFRGCSQGGIDRMVSANGEVSYCGWKTVSISQVPGALERLADGSSAPSDSTNSFVVYYFDASGRQSDVSNVAVRRAYGSPTPISDLRIENGELRWTAPQNVSRYFVRFYTGETTSRSAGFSGCGMDIPQEQNPNGSAYCVGHAISISRVLGALERLQLEMQPVKSFVVTYRDATGRNSEVSNVAVYRSSIPAKFITLNSPNGGEVWTAGNHYLVRWSGQGLSTTVSNDWRSGIELVLMGDGGDNSPVLACSAATVTSAGGSAVCTVPSGVKAGNYKVSVMDNSAGIHDTSDGYIRVSSNQQQGSPDLQIRWVTFAPINFRGQKDVLTINLCNVGDGSHTAATTADRQGFGSISFRITLNGFSDTIAPDGANDEQYAGQCQLFDIPNLLDGFSPFSHKNVPAGKYDLDVVLQNRDSTNPHFVTGITVGGGTGTFPAQLVLMASEGSNGFVRLTSGQKVSLASNIAWGTSLALQGVKADQLRCVLGAVNTSNTMKWDCTALRSLTGTQGNSEVFYAIDSRRSNSVVIQVDAGSSSSSAPSGQIPPAGYEDEILTNIEAYQNPFPDTDINQLSGKAAAELYRRAVIGGFPDGQFKGDRFVTRGETAKFFLLAKFQQVADVANNGQFRDVLDGQWYTKFVVTAAMKGIISGYPQDGTFRPANRVVTSEFLKMFALTFDLKLNLPYQYRDVAADDWFAPYAGIAQKYNLFPGRSAYLQPGKELTREEVAVAIYQFLSNR